MLPLHAHSAVTQLATCDQVIRFRADSRNPKPRNQGF